MSANTVARYWLHLLDNDTGVLEAAVIGFECLTEDGTTVFVYDTDDNDPETVDAIHRAYHAFPDGLAARWGLLEVPAGVV